LTARTVYGSDVAVVCVCRVRVLIKASRSYLRRNCGASSSVRRKRQTDSSDDDDDDEDEHLNKQLMSQAVTHGTQDIEQVDTLLCTIYVNKLQFIHTVNGDGSKTTKIIKRNY